MKHGRGLLLALGAALLYGCATPGPQDAEFDTGYTPLRTEQLFSARYYDEGETLIVVHRTGDVYEYRGVPRAMVDQFFAAEHKDQFYLDHLKGRFGEQIHVFDVPSPDRPSDAEERSPVVPAAESAEKS